MRNRLVLFFASLSFLVSFLLGVPVVEADIYKWVDENGNVHFSENKPPGIDAEKKQSSEKIAAEVANKWYTGMGGLKIAEQMSIRTNAPILLFFHDPSCEVCVRVIKMLEDEKVGYCLERMIKVRMSPKKGSPEKVFHDSLVPSALHYIMPRLFLIDDYKSKPRMLSVDPQVLQYECIKFFGTEEHNRREHPKAGSK